MFPSLALIVLCGYLGLVQVHTKNENILLILVDDLGNADASFNFNITHRHRHINDAPIPTPNIDRLAHSGIIFSNHFTQWLCGPSRSALLTSRYSVNIGNPFAVPVGGGLAPFIPTFVHELQRRKYRTSLIGKWGVDLDGRHKNHLTNEWQPSLKELYPNNQYNNHGLGPLARGFDNFYGLYHSEHEHFSKKMLGSLDWHIFNETHFIEDPDIDPETHLSSTHIFVRETISKMRAHINPSSAYYKQPFFIFLSLTMPHDPLQVDEQYIVNEPKCSKILNKRRRIYCGMVQCVDEGIQNITTFMQKHNLLSNSIVYFTSDNGGTPNFGGFNYPYRGAKASGYHGGTKTPAFIYAPAMFQRTSGMVYNGYFHLIDFGPTVLSLIDDDSNDSTHGMASDIDGMDLSFILKHFDSKSDVRSDIQRKNVRNDVIIEHNGWSNMSIYIDGEYKLCLGHIGASTVYVESNTKWTVHDDNATVINTLHQIFNELMEWTLPLHIVSGMEWVLMWNTQGVRIPILDGVSTEEYDHEHVINRHPNGRLKYGEKGPRALYIPYLNWSDHDNWKNIRLFHMKLDPSESNNIAMKNKEKVRQMYDKLVAQLIRGAESKYAEDRSYLFHTANYAAYCIVVVMLFGFFCCGIMTVCCLYCKCCYKVHKVRNFNGKAKTE